MSASPMLPDMETFAVSDVVVIGAGHAGCEAALAAARMGCHVLVVTTNLDRVGFMPCNPSIGGPGKSQIVAEVDALGGAMAEVADAAALQLRMLNTSKGPAVRSLRGQMDKGVYAALMRERLETHPNVRLVQDEAVAFRIRGGEQRVVEGVRLRSRGDVAAQAVVVTAGTFLRGEMIGGEARAVGGRAGDAATTLLATDLTAVGIETRRFKTGTPPRLDVRTVDLSLTEPQPGDDESHWFSDAGARGRIALWRLEPAPHWAPHLTQLGGRAQLPCFRAATNEATHELIRANLHRAPMYTGEIVGVGPRYCPSVEDKVARFADKPSHPIFLEPEGWRSGELYVQGMSTSLPYDVQLAALRTVPALREAEITRPGYAVEYDAVAPGMLHPTLETRAVAGLFLAGQVNGTSGYEEAAGQGILAGINAAAMVRELPPLTLRRDEAYIGVMVDDLVYQPHAEPYRMLTARAEYRLTLRSSTAHARLLPHAVRYGLLDERQARERLADQALVARLLAELEAAELHPSTEMDARLRAIGEAGLSKPMTARELGRRPSMSLARLSALLEPSDAVALAAVPERLCATVDEELHYGGFIERERRQVERSRALVARPLMVDDFAAVPGLRVEARQRLEARRPTTFGAAQAIAGVTPADIAALLVYAQKVEARS